MQNNLNIKIRSEVSDKQLTYCSRSSRIVQYLFYLVVVY